MRVTLVSHDYWTPQQKIVLPKLPVVVGRGPDAEVSIDDRWVSRIHCAICVVDGMLVVRDLESSNGTLVNGKSITEALLLPGDTLTIGVTRFEVHYTRQNPKPLVYHGHGATGRV
ncbi:MAG: FHA domain-containing protein [Candidatus Nealsonbacteria bacterium]|nr:FHA domain-containing protein [Candidatus Nealsonbacteria bacterium]